MEPPSLAARAGQDGAAHGPLLHVLAGHVRDGRVGERGTGAAAWLAAALAPGSALFVVAPPAALEVDSDVHPVSDLAAEAPYELLALADPEPEEALGLLALLDGIEQESRASETVGTVRALPVAAE